MQHAGLQGTNESDRLCRACGGTGEIAERDPERRFDKVASTYCECQRDRINTGATEANLRRAHEDVCQSFADDLMSAHWLDRYSQEELDDIFLAGGFDEKEAVDGFCPLESVRLVKSWGYREPEADRRPFRDNFRIGQEICIRNTKEIYGGGAARDAAIVLDTAPRNMLARQSASERLKAGLIQYRRAQAVEADIRKAEKTSAQMVTLVAAE